MNKKVHQLTHVSSFFRALSNMVLSVFSSVGGIYYVDMSMREYNSDIARTNDQCKNDIFVTYLRDIVCSFATMLVIGKNCDVICFQLRNDFYPQLESSIKKELSRLSNDIKAIITSGEKVKVQSQGLLSQVFNFRVKALKWLAVHKRLDYPEILNDVFPQIEKFKSNRKLEVLSENILFALRCNQRVVESLFGASEASASNFTSNISGLPDITYQQFIASIAFANIDDETAQKIVDWTNASLYVEFVLVAADIIADEKLKVSDLTINELAFLVADAAQEYSALAKELGIFKINSTTQSFSNLSFDKSFIKEQKHLADLGLDDFASNLLN